VATPPSSAPEHQPPAPAGNRLLAQIGGFVCGVVGGLLASVTVVFSGSGVVASLILVGLLLVVAIVAIATSSVRNSGTGFLAGLAVGYIVFAGSCGLIFLTLLAPR
jgi:predicted lipid-binding transport protein (Tim44 family)